MISGIRLSSALSITPRRVFLAPLDSRPLLCWGCHLPPCSFCGRPRTTWHHFLSGLPFPASALQPGTLDLGCPPLTHLSSAAHPPPGPLGSGTVSGCWAPQSPGQAEIFSTSLKRQWLRRPGSYSTSCHRKMLREV